MFIFFPHLFLFFLLFFLPKNCKNFLDFTLVCAAALSIDKSRAWDTQLNILAIFYSSLLSVIVTDSWTQKDKHLLERFFFIPWSQSVKWKLKSNGYPIMIILSQLLSQQLFFVELIFHVSFCPGSFQSSILLSLPTDTLSFSNRQYFSQVN